VTTNSGNDKQTPEPFEGLRSQHGRFAIVASRFNAHVVDRLVEGALEAFDQKGTPRDEVPVFRVPGAFELPLAVGCLIDTGDYDAVVALGCVIRGETPHFEHVSRTSTDGLAQVSLEYGVPVGFGVLTTDDLDQAMTRSGGDVGNKGFDAAIAAIEMTQFLGDL
jgi:6,7-dimethyl-8-ribityllumazine synthase